MALLPPSYQKRTALFRKTCIAAERNSRHRFWYREMNRRLQDLSWDTGYSVEWLACVMSASSPRVHVKKNIRFLEALIAEPHTKPSGMMENVWVSVCRVIQAQPGHRLGAIKGRKTQAFAANLMGDFQKVTLDVWMARHFEVDQSVFRTNLYEWYANVVKDVAAKLEITPAEVQAAIWADSMIQHGRNPG